MAVEHHKTRACDRCGARKVEIYREHRIKAGTRKESTNPVSIPVFELPRPIWSFHGGEVAVQTPSRMDLCKNCAKEFMELVDSFLQVVG